MTKPYGKPISSREIKKKNSKTEFTIESRWNHQNTNISLECDNSPKELLGFSIVGINWFHLDNPWSKFRKSNQFDDTKAEINSEVIELAFNCCQKIIDAKQAYPRISLVPVPVLRTGQ
ncbi:MAG: hypothetical protein PHH77_10560 [Victivallaceae bacterium]|nr:hypothetical protein [Victivallaceae bacterium]